MKMIKWFFAWLFYSMGHVVSLLMSIRFMPDWAGSILYSIYTKLMGLSSNIQGHEKNSKGPWKDMGDKYE